MHVCMCVCVRWYAGMYNILFIYNIFNVRISLFSNVKKREIKSGAGPVPSYNVWSSCRSRPWCCCTCCCGDFCFFHLLLTLTSISVGFVGFIRLHPVVLSWSHVIPRFSKWLSIFACSVLLSRLSLPSLWVTCKQTSCHASLSPTLLNALWTKSHFLFCDWKLKFSNNRQLLWL